MGELEATKPGLNVRYSTTRPVTRPDMTASGAEDRMFYRMQQDAAGCGLRFRSRVQALCHTRALPSTPRFRCALQSFAVESRVDRANLGETAWKIVRR